MMSCNLFSKQENDILQAMVHKHIKDLNAFVLEYRNGLRIFAYIQLIFEDNTSVIITTGSFADNLVLMNESVFIAEKEKYDVQDDVTVKATTLNGNYEIIGKQLINVKCVQKPDEEYYWQLVFDFESKLLKINALIDEIDFSLS